MKTMTCRQMGGPCDAAFHGDKADEVIKAQDSHLKDMVAGGDKAHESALKSVRAGGRIPFQGWAGTGRPRRPSQLFPKPDSV